MASSKVDDFRSFDWDDSALIKAYNKGTKLREKASQKGKNSKVGNSSKENVKEKKEWKLGAYCRVKYHEDGQMYEATILSIRDGQCNVEFIGYGDTQLVRMKDLHESAGKKARWQQKEAALGGYSSASESCLNSTTDTESEDQRKYKPNEDAAADKTEANPAAAAETLYMNPPNPSHFASGYSHGATCYAPLPPSHIPNSIPTSMPFLPGPPVPPMPQCPSVAQNPSLSAMLVSWYMAGYYTGLNQAHSGQTGCQSSQRCCNHSNRCCH